MKLALPFSDPLACSPVPFQSCAGGPETQAPHVVYFPHSHHGETAALSRHPRQFPGGSNRGRQSRMTVTGTLGDNASPHARRTRGSEVEQADVSLLDVASNKGGVYSGEGTKIPPNDANELVVKEVEEDDMVDVADPSSKLMFAYPQGPSEASLIQFDSMDDIAAELANSIEELSRKAVEARGVFSIVLSGGSLVKALASLPGRSIAWDSWHVFWADERLVPLDHPDSNYKAAKDEFLSKVPIPPANVYAIDDTLSVAAAAEAYEAKLRELVSRKVLSTTKGGTYPRFDLMLLGLGPDGHVASLFPNSPLLGAKGRWVLPISNSPKPPPQRITLSLQAINCARTVFFVAAGKSKAFTLERVLERAALPGALPAQMVHPYKGTITWFVDADATTELHFEDWGNAKKYPYLDFSQVKKA